MMCRHCQKMKSNRPRDLCWSCYYTPGVREQYPSTSKFARRGAGNGNRQGELPELTDALPGTPEKVQVLQERARRGQCLFHPLDARLDDEGHPCRAEHGQEPVKAASCAAPGGRCRSG